MIFSRSTEVEVEDVRVGRIRIVIRENALDRIIGWFDPERLQRRLQARAALEGRSSPGGAGRSVISKGIEKPKREGFSHWGSSDSAARFRRFNG